MAIKYTNMSYKDQLIVLVMPMYRLNICKHILYMHPILKATIKRKQLALWRASK